MEDVSTHGSSKGYLFGLTKVQSDGHVPDNDPDVPCVVLVFVYPSLLKVRVDIVMVKRDVFLPVRSAPRAYVAVNVLVHPRL